jgi:large subunit ribosomal protein L7/L12
MPIDVNNPMTAEEILKVIESMTVLELNDLVKTMQERWGVSPVVSGGFAPGAAATSGAAAAGEAATEEKTTFDVVLTGFGDKKIQVIKAVREIINLGLKEAKDLVEASGTPPGKVVKEGASKEEVQQLKAKLEKAGGTVEIK